MLLWGVMCSSLNLCAQSATTWIGPSGGAWSDPANWSTATVPNATDTAYFSVTPKSNLAISLVGAPAAVGRINVSLSLPEGQSLLDGNDSVVLGSAESPDDELTLASSTATPIISVVNLSTLKFNGLLFGTQGFNKIADGTLSFRDNPHTQTYSGNITLFGGILEIAADTNLGNASNFLIFNGNAKIISNPADPSVPVQLAATRGINVASPNVATLGNTNKTGSLILNGPLSGSGGVTFNGIGALTLSGTNTSNGNWGYSIQPPVPGPAQGRFKSTTSTGVIIVYYLTVPPVVAENINWSSQLKFEGPNAFPQILPSLAISASSGYYLRGSSCENRIDLGNQSRRIGNLSFSASPPAGSTNSSFDTVIANGELIADSATIAVTVPNGASDSGLSNTLSFDQVPQLTITGSVAVTAPSSRTAGTVNSARIRIGTRAQFNLSSLTIAGDADCRLDAVNPGSTLKIRGNSGLEESRVPLFRLGYGGSSSNTTSRSLLDLADGCIDILADRIQIHGQSSDYGTAADSVARLSFSAGSLDVSTLELGSSGSRGSLECSVVQSGGSAIVGSLRFGAAYTGSIPNKRTRFAYQLNGGRLALNTVTADAAYNASGLTRALDWTSGTIVANNATTQLNSASIVGPLDINLMGEGTKILEVPATNSATFGSYTRLRSDAASTTLTKTGPGALILAGDSSDFSGLLQLADGALVLGSGESVISTPLGSFRWDKGTISCDLSALNETSDRLVIGRSLSRGTGPASTRILDLKSSLGSGTYTLATYTSTDITLADFNVTGIRPGYTADFTVGPTALTVTLAPDTAYTTWRRATLASASNTGSATDLADPDSDGRPNLLEYATGTEPLAAEANQVTAIAATPANRLALTFNRIEDVYLRYTVQASASPAGPWDEVVFTSTGTDNLAGPITVEDTVSLADFSTRFLRLQVTRLSAPTIP